MNKTSFTPFILAVLLLTVALFQTSCDLINPDEQIPAFLKIDSIPLVTSNGQGSRLSSFTDAWVFQDEKIVGVYELPAVIPILEEGATPIRIRPGIKVNGSVGTRRPYVFAEDFTADLQLYPDSQLHINPAVAYRDWVTFEWLEDFSIGNGLSLASTSTSEASVTRISGEDALEGSSGRLSLDAEKLIFECKTVDKFDLPGGGAPVIFEFSYKCNHSFVAGIFAKSNTGSLQNPILVLAPTEEWKRVYISLTDVLTTSINYEDFQPFFGYIRAEGFEEEINVYLDNIKLIY